VDANGLSSELIQIVVHRESMGVTVADDPAVLASLFRLTNLHGALVTMPHKVKRFCSLAARSSSAHSR
jgi:hypothetical protein